VPHVAAFSASGSIRAITSKQNAHVRSFRALARARKPSDTRILIDGWHLLLEARRANLRIERAAFTTDLLDTPDASALAGELAAAGTEVFAVDVPVMKAISPVRTPSGVTAIAHHATTGLARAFASAPQLVLLAVDIQDPGNLGAMVRAGEAAGATGLVACGASADPLGWKALRGSMGSAFRVPIARADLDAAMAAARAAGLQLLAAVPRIGQSLFDTDLRMPTALLLGSEGPGLPLGVLEEVDATVSIPMRPPVESLNVAVATALFFYEALRQRTTGAP